MNISLKSGRTVGLQETQEDFIKQCIYNQTLTINKLPMLCELCPVRNRWNNSTKGELKKAKGSERAESEIFLLLHERSGTLI